MTAPTIAATSTTSAAPSEPTAGEFRYPGSPPFADTELSRLVFHGRAHEIDQVLHSILSFDLFLVYAVSGLGKTSLLSAGVFEHLHGRGLFPVMIRLNDPSSSPIALIDAQIREAGANTTGIAVLRHPLAGRVPSNGGGDAGDTSLWDLLNTIEIWRDSTLLKPVLVFDQFEELFTLAWEHEQRQRFIAELGQVIRRHRPPASAVGDEDRLAMPPPNVKIAIIIREDFIGELEALAADVPQIMAHRFRLDGLQPDQAKAAICAPAEVDDLRLATRRFGYTEAAAQMILDFLGARESSGRAALSRSIDPCQLQIICQHVERSILPAKLDADQRPAEISEDDLGGRDGLERILSDFYRREVASFPASQRKLVRELCESGLINQNRRRLSLEEGEIASRFHVTKPMLDELVARRLLRSEPRVGSVYYELAHDTLTVPILAYREGQHATRRRRVRRWIAALVALLLVLTIALSWWVRRSDEPADEVVVQPITIGADPVVGTMAANLFEFDVERRQTLAIEVEPDDGESLILELRYPSGETEEITTGSDPTIEHSVVASAIGTYTLEVNGPSTAEFEVRVRRNALVPLVLDQAHDDRITNPSDRETYLFDPQRGQPVMFELTAGPEVDAVLEVTGPRGRVERRDEVGKGLTERFALSGVVDGPFRVQVYSVNGAVGSYTLSAASLPLHTVEAGKSAAERIAAPGDVGVFEIAQPVDAFAIVRLLPGSSIDGVIEIVSAADTPPGTVDRDGAGGAEVTVIANLPALPLRMIVRSYELTTGPYQLETAPLPAVELAFGTPVEGRLTETNPFALFRVAIAEQAEFEIELGAGEELRAAAVLISETGDLIEIESNDPTTFTLDAGQYWLGVDSTEGATGSFTLAVERA